MTKTTITWYNPEEKTPENGQVLALCETGYIATLSVYNGHFNCSNDDLESEMHALLWAYMPQKLTDIAKEDWKKRYDV